MNLIELISNVSVGTIKFGDQIEDYLHFKYNFHPKIIDVEQSSEDLYEFINPSLSVFVNDKNQISSISCHLQCFWNNINLIGSLFNEFLSIANVDPDDEEEIYISTGENIGQYQKVYDFVNLGLQIWTFKNTIITVGCTNYDL